VTVLIKGAAPLTAGHCHVIAEAGVNHNNSIERAIEMAQKAHAAGAWAIKFQLYTADSLAVPDSPKYWSDPFGTSSQYEAFQASSQLDYRDYGPLAEACESLGIVFFATPFDLDAVDALERMRAPLYKIASGDITHRPLIEAVAATGKPVIMSTGAARVEEIRRAIEWSGLGPDRLVLLLCTLTYPTPDVDAHFSRLVTMRELFSPYLIGVSDHTLGVAGAWLTAALGGVCIEKHYTLDKSLPDVPDHAISVEPNELREMVAACDRTAILLGSSELRIQNSEMPARENARRSIVLDRDVPAGGVLAEQDLAFKRPGTGIPPADLDTVVGRRLHHALQRGAMLSHEDLV
jgi:N,N'-diacetyllegionaminate synthase